MTQRLVYLQGITLSMTDDEIIELYTRTAPDRYAIQNLEDHLENWRDDEALDDEGKFRLLDFDLDQWREDHARMFIVMLERKRDCVEPDGHFDDIWSARQAAHKLATQGVIDVYIDCFTQFHIEGRTDWVYEYHEDVMFAGDKKRATELYRSIKRVQMTTSYGVTPRSLED